MLIGQSDGEYLGGDRSLYILHETLEFIECAFHQGGVVAGVLAVGEEDKGVLALRPGRLQDLHDLLETDDKVGRALGLALFYVRHKHGLAIHEVVPTQFTVIEDSFDGVKWEVPL